MQLKNNTVLITGGSSGIGLELTRILVEKQNKVIICGRSEEKLKQAKEKIPELVTYSCDLTDKKQCEQLAEWIKAHHSDLNILVNNAALVHRINFLDDPKSLDKLEVEVQTNFLAPVWLIKLLYPILMKNQNKAVINITTGLIFAPRAIYPFYNATKAALHSFTQVFRFQSKESTCKVFEVLFPAVDTPWHKGNPPKIAISVEQAVKEMIEGLEKDKFEIKIAAVKKLYLLSRIMPGLAFKKINAMA
jgi:uncharacterized oxidoreductase